ncbi:hypothetical protein FSARC_4792 [Fusarium sarcochroum]|uniref:Carboxylesterase type B domain-containing protein n=1 Tax=Fusarium sarcochroum TaxID=1208366 RepID=A0A8H4U0U6_9HYPO|nr:hypothetical protein FSARC_4792 [Fusarium sarcochroum]
MCSWRPQAISSPEAVDNELAAIQKHLAKPEFPGLSGTECLNLNIVAPASAISSSAFPVMVYIHGGGFSVGANWWPQFDMKRIVQLSIDIGKPIIGINIKLGAPGFMTSEELRQAGYKSNRGLNDQIVALKWVKRYIAGFGGDPSQVTVAGESVGGLSAARLLYREEDLASRIVVMGGAPPSVSPLTSKVAEFAYKSAVKVWGIGVLSTGERLKYLENLFSLDLHQKIEGLPFLPVLDDDLVPYHESFELMASEDFSFKAKQCKGAMIVFSPLDASIFAFMGLFAARKSIAVDFTNHLQIKFSQHQVAIQQLLKAYDISPDLNNQTALLNVLKFGSDIGHQAAARALANKIPGHALLMQFSEPNPWDGPFKGHSTHILDVAFLLQNFNNHLDDTQRASAVQFAEDVITFVHGEEPWEAFSKAQGTAILRGGRRQYLEGDQATSKKYQELMRIAEIIVHLPASEIVMSVTIRHDSLQTTLRGVETAGVTQFQGIPYGYIPRRFAEAEKIQHFPKDLDCTEFGPKCPQIHVDVGHLLRIPPHHRLPREPEDEFNCTNLDVVLPKTVSQSESAKLPVLVWIHGGSQAVTFGSAVSGYRLNVFALGNREGPVNLALRDQALALQWVQEHIAGFNGDPTKVTLAGESAGAVYCHAHLVTNALARQYILSSGSLFLSPPQPPESVQALRDAVLKQLQHMDPSLDLENAPTNKVVEAVKLSGLQSFLLQWEDRFAGWQKNTGVAEGIMLSDAAIWQMGVRNTSSNDIMKAFNTAGEHSDELKRAYHIYTDRPSSCQTGALDFINDYKFVLPINHLEKLWKDSQKPVFRYLVDEANPWQPSSGAHHAVDLILLFGGFDLRFSRGAELSGQAMREAWIKFVNLEQPWTQGSDSCFSFGPHGTVKVLNDWELQARRRVVQTEMLNRMDSTLLDKVFVGLAAGKVSLMN